MTTNQDNFYRSASLTAQMKSTGEKLPFLISSLFLLFGVLVFWFVDTVTVAPFIKDVYAPRKIAWFESRNLYLLINAATILGPLLLSFDQKVGYYKKWKALFPAIVLVGAGFIVWDIYFTEQGVWGFNPAYHREELALFGLPPGEWLFFLTVPFSCVFIYECLHCYFKKFPFDGIEKPFTLILILFLLVYGLVHWGDMYTMGTALLATAFLLYQFAFGNPKIQSRFYTAYLISWIPFMMVDGILTGGYMQEPLVMYNPEEFSGWRILSVPFDDSVYSLLLLFLVVELYERFLGRF